MLPLAFIARKDEDSSVAALWGDIWEEGTTSISAALRLYAADIVPLLNAGESVRREVSDFGRCPVGLSPTIY